MPSFAHFPLQGSLDATYGQSSLLQPSGRKGLLTEIPENNAGPGTSTTLTEVPLGPGVVAKIILSFLARKEFWVVGTIRVVVAPIFLNQVLLSSFILPDLSSFDL